MNAEQALEELGAPVKSFRIMALEWAIHEGNGPALLQALEKRQTEESDEECLSLLSHAIYAVQRRSEGGKLPAKLIHAFPDTFSAASPHDKIEILRNLQTAEKRRHAQMVPGLLAGETDPAVATALIRLFLPFWPEPGIEELLEKLDSPFLGVRIAALEGLATRAPVRLSAKLPALLQSSDPRIRAVAIQAQARISPEDALAQTAAMLSSPFPETRACGLQVCCYLPFALIKPQLHGFIAVESNLELVKRAGVLFQSNPDQETPFNLMEMADTAPPAKANLLRGFARGAAQAVAGSGIMGSKGDEFVKLVQARLGKRQGVRYVRELVTAAILDEPRFMICPDQAKTSVPPLEFLQEALREAETWDLPPLLLENLRVIVKG
ncbi:MAG: HEAT repeat domain-containing protein [Candidatus Ozemobacteraceae bacterium]